jgi:hypothetical protein
MGILRPRSLTSVNNGLWDEMDVDLLIVWLSNETDTAWSMTGARVHTMGAGCFAQKKLQSQFGQAYI